MINIEKEERKYSDIVITKDGRIKVFNNREMF